MKQLILFLCMGYILGGIFSVPFHADEADHLFKSQDYVAYFVLGDPFRLRVDPPVAINSEQHIRLLTGTTSAYLTGFVLWHTGVRLWPSAWYYPESVESNRQAGRWPSDSILWRGRLASAFLTALSVVCVFHIAQKLSPHRQARIGLFSALLFTLHPVILLNGRRVMQEGTLLFLTLLLVWQAIRTVENPTWKNWSGLGVISGCAFASKPTALLAIIGVLVGVVIANFLLPFIESRCMEQKTEGTGAVYDPPRALKLFVYPLGGFLMAASLVYLLLTPAIWNNPPARLLLAAQLRQDALQGQASASPQAYTNWGERTAALLTQPYPATIHYYESPDFASDSKLNNEIRRYEKSWWDGVKIPMWLGMGWVMLGFTAILMPLIGKNETKVKKPVMIFLSWVLITLIGLFVSVPMAWQRYYLPLTLIGIFLAGFGLDFLTHTMHASLRFLRR